jgi:hypothetical protein
MNLSAVTGIKTVIKITKLEQAYSKTKYRDTLDWGSFHRRINGIPKTITIIRIHNTRSLWDYWKGSDLLVTSAFWILVVAMGR